MLKKYSFCQKKQLFIWMTVLGFCMPQGVAFAQFPNASEADSSFQAATPNPIPNLSPNSFINDFYILGAGDEISVTVFGYEEYTQTKIISPDGTITLPIIGSVFVADKTTDVAASAIANRLNEFLIDPIVTVDAVTLRPLSITVAGEVQRPGPMQLKSLSTVASNYDYNSDTTLPTLSQALLQAGGVSRDADIRQVQIRRSLPNGNETILTVNLWDDIWADNAEDDLFLQDGDDIFVPRLTNEQELDRRLIARSSLAPETVRVRVVGEVTRPGEVLASPDSSLSSAIAIAGGPTTDANLSRVAFIRLNQNGQIEREELDLSNLSDDHQVQDGDVLIVPKGSTFSALDFAGRLLNPLGSLFSIFNFLDD